MKRICFSAMFYAIISLYFMAFCSFAAELGERREMTIGNNSQYIYREVCIDGVKFIKMNGGDATLVQVFVPIKNIITTYQCASGNGNCYPTFNTIITSVPAACNK